DDRRPVTAARPCIEPAFAVAFRYAVGRVVGGVDGGAEEDLGPPACSIGEFDHALSQADVDVGELPRIGRTVGAGQVHDNVQAVKCAPPILGSARPVEPPDIVAASANRVDGVTPEKAARTGDDDIHNAVAAARTSGNSRSSA